MKNAIKFLKDYKRGRVNPSDVLVLSKKEMLFEGKIPKVIIIEEKPRPGTTRNILLNLEKRGKREGRDFFLGYRTRLTKNGKHLISGISEESSYVIASISEYLDEQPVEVLNSVEGVEIADHFIKKISNSPPDKLLYICDLKKTCKKYNVNWWSVFNSI